MKKIFGAGAVATALMGTSVTADVARYFTQGDALAVLNEVTRRFVQIIGFSDGAYTAYKIAAICPDRSPNVGKSF